MRILRGISGYFLDCGCLIGAYETYDGRTVCLFDACGPACSTSTHRVNAVLRVESDQHLACARSGPYQPEKSKLA